MISIHALLAESDLFLTLLIPCRKIFLSTLSLRRATMDSSRAASCQQHFYPRSPCGERLSLRVLLICPPLDFYPRSPCGERLFSAVFCLGAKAISIHALLAESDSLTLIIGFSGQVFLSTLSLRRATQQPAGQKQRT